MTRYYDPQLMQGQDFKASLLEEQRAYDIWTSNYPAYAIVETDKKRAAIVDALVTFESGLYAVVEVKSRRTLTLDKLKHQYHNRILLMDYKLENCQKLAKSLCTNLLIFYYLVADDTLIVQHLQDTNGNQLVQIDHTVIDVPWTNNETTRHQQRGVYIDLHGAHYLKMKGRHSDTSPLSEYRP